MKTILIGKVAEVKAIETKDNYSSQRITIVVQEFDQATGEAKDPQVFPVTIFNKKIKELAPEQYQGK